MVNNAVYIVNSTIPKLENIAFHGIFSDEESAIRECNNVIKIHNWWLVLMKMPLQLYLDNIDSFKSGNGEYVWEDRFGYTAKQWENAHSQYQENEHNGTIEVTVSKHVLDETKHEYIKTETVFKKVEPSVTGKEPKDTVDFLRELGLV